MFAVDKMSGDNGIVGDAVFGQTLQTTLLKRALDAPFSAPQHLSLIHRLAQVIHSFVHSFFQQVVACHRSSNEKPQQVAYAQTSYYYCFFLIIIKTAVVVGGCGYVDKVGKAFPDTWLRHFLTVDNFVHKLNNLWKTCVTGLAQVILISCFFVQGRADAGEILVNMNAIASIESSGNPKAWNRGEDARGMFQLRNDVLKEWNQFNPKEKHEPDELFDEDINTKLARWYLEKRIPQMIRHFKKPLSTRNVIIAYNAGINYVKTGKDLPRATVNYLQKYERIAA